MNFIWDIKLQAARDGLESNDLFFKPAEQYSPYIEQSFKDINQSHVDKAEIEINPLMRFASIFEYILHPDVIDLIFAKNKQFILHMFDVMIHILTEVDLCHGMTKREFYIRRVRQELLSSYYGETAAEGMKELSREKQVAVADELFRVMEIGSSVDSFCYVMKQIFKGCIIYQDRKHPQRLYVYIGKEKDEHLQKQWRLIRETFLPIDIEVKEFWSEHFGILGVDVTMIADEIAIF